MGGHVKSMWPHKPFQQAPERGVQTQLVGFRCTQLVLKSCKRIDQVAYLPASTTWWPALKCLVFDLARRMKRAEKQLVIPQRLNREVVRDTSERAKLTLQK